MGYTTWIDQQIADAERRGLFDNLPGAGKPLNLRPSGEDYGEAWVRDYARREGVQPEEFLPTPLRLRREIERLTESVGGFRSEAEIREIAADINRRIIEWRRIPVGPPIHVRLVNADDLVARWRAATRVTQTQSAQTQSARTQSARTQPGSTQSNRTDPHADAADASSRTSQPPQSSAGTKSRRPRWWRSRRQTS